VDLEAFAALATPSGRRVLDALPPYDEAEALALGARLRRTEPASLVAAALTQSRLRARAVAKFGADAAAMYFTPDGLEQATRAPVAELRARRFTGAGLATVGRPVRGRRRRRDRPRRAGLGVTAVERDPLTAAVLRANVEALGLAPQVQVVEGDAAGGRPAAVRRGVLRPRAPHVARTGLRPPVVRAAVDVRHGPARRRPADRGSRWRPGCRTSWYLPGVEAQWGLRPRRGQGGRPVVGRAGLGRRAARDPPAVRRGAAGRGDRHPAGRPAARVPLRTRRRGDPRRAGRRARRPASTGRSSTPRSRT
jgi:hypothetical protein